MASRTLSRAGLGAVLLFTLLSAACAQSVKLLVPASYLPAIPVLVRVELLDGAGQRDREAWDAEALLTGDQPGVTLSTNRLQLRNGLGSALVTFSGGGDFTLTATVAALRASRALQTRASDPVTTIGGTLPGTATIWNGVVRLTNDVTVPNGHTLTIQSNTLVLINGVASGTAAPDLFINGTVQCLGTEQYPVTLTCASAGLRWGQIRHNNAQPSLYRWTVITRGGRAAGEGHTGQAPVIRPNNSTIVFESCSITDHAEVASGSPGFGTPGKILYAIGSDLTFNNCLLGRARMGPEIQSTALLCTNTWIMDMNGPDDADGIYLHDQSPGQQLRLTGCVLAFGDDDGIDTLSSDVTVDGCIIRNWSNPSEDAKGISVFNQTVNIQRCLIVDCWVGVSAKWSGGAAARVNLNRCTVVGISNSIAANLKDNAPGPFIDYRITNSIVWGADALKSDFGDTNFTVRYCNLSELWSGAGNLSGDPRFVSASAHDYHLLPGSPCINSGDPASPADPDGSQADMGAFPFSVRTNNLVALGSLWRYLDNGSDQGAGWTAPGFADAAWPLGPAQLGYGDGDEATVVGFGPDPNNKHVTTYFRQNFTVANPAQYTNLLLRLLRDDGAVVYINGQEVQRESMPPGAISYQTLATTQVEYDFATNFVPATVLVPGTNVVAAEVHQGNTNSSDLSFALELAAVTAPNSGNTPPLASITAPANNASFAAPANITIAVNASDTDGSVVKVEFFQSGLKLGEDAVAPFAYQWTNVSAGGYTLTAVATDDLGATGTSSPISVTVTSAGGTTNALVGFGSTWKYLDNGSDQGTGWTASGFNDSAWPSGPAQLGYGDGDEVTLVSFGPNANNKYVTTYFRRVFQASNASSYTGLILRLLRDDGGVVYLNGLEVYRSANMPAGPITFTTLATATGENSLDTVNLSAGALFEGNNVLAVEMHQQALASSDLSFDLELSGVTSGSGNLPPTVSITSPANNSSFEEPADITIAIAASDSDGAVSKVEFFQNSIKLGEDLTSPYSFAWNGVGIGNYALTAVATDDDGAAATSSPVAVIVNLREGVTTNVVIATMSDWKYLDDGSDQGTNWNSLGFNDGTWASGPAELGYGDGDEATVVGFGPDPQNKYVTTYFRRLFTVEDPSLVLSLTMNLLRDDGAIAYVNGVEVYRLSLPPEPVTFQTFATTAAEYGFEATGVPPGLLRAGANVVAVEVHQANGSSSDVSFDLELIAVFNAPTNFRPDITITAPANGITVAAPANFTIQAAASDRDGTVIKVEFFANGAKLGEDLAGPYNFPWNSVPAGNYTLTAVATDNVGFAATSSVVNLTVSTNAAPPVVANKSPVPGNVTNLTQIAVTFSKPVLGVDASDLLVNGAPATSLNGSGNIYTFTFPQPAYGAANITWAAAHGITDIFTPPNAFNRTGPGATWQYQLLDALLPVAASIHPVPGSTVAALTSVSVTFSELVSGVSAADLLVNSAPASAVAGTGAGPYAFSFAQPPQGAVQVRWSNGHGIQDSSGNGFAGGAWTYTLDTNSTGVVITEIMHHPSSENILEEYIELFNKGASAVNLTGWRLSAGVQFAFSNVTLPAGGYLVVAADRTAFANKYPGVTNVVGNWTGFLNNSGEDIDLDDASGRRADSVRYADEGEWGLRQRGPLDAGHRGWSWFAEHDGLGKSLELLNPNLSNNSGQNWASSRATNGTPGRANSVFTNDLAPMILEAAHSPLVPRSADPVLVTARIVDESVGGLVVTLNYRPSTAAPPPFTALALRDDGSGGDAVAADGLYSAGIPPQLDNTVIEFYLSAVDAQSHTRTWPAPAIAAADGAGPTGQVVNALFQVDDSNYTGSQPLYKLIMTEPERAELAGIPSMSSVHGPNSQMNASFLSIDGAGTECRYLTGIRNRGHGSRGANPPNYRVNFRSDDPWKNTGALNLNVVQVHVQHLGSALARKAGAAGGNSIAVQVRVNNQNRAIAGAPMFGSYAANEVYDSRWADTHFPFDPNGNIYRVVRDLPPSPNPRFDYRGEDAGPYRDSYVKESNVSEDDWSDLIGMLRVAGMNNLTPFTTENVQAALNVEQWLRHLAVMNLFANGESGLNTGNNDDYFMYRGVADPRFILLYHDLDQILGQGGSMPANTDIFRATCCPISGDSEGSFQAMDRLMHWPDFEPIYFRILLELLETTFSATQFNAMVDQTLGSYVDPGAISAIKSWMDARRAYVLSVLPPVAPNMPPVAVVAGAPRSPTPLTSATLTVSGLDVTHYRSRLNGGAYGPETSIGTPITLNGLVNGTNSVSVIGRNSAGVWQEQAAATVRTWVVNTSWPAVRLNEVLARNVAAVSHSGTFPDLVELYNEGAAALDLSGLRLTDDPADPNKFTFAPGTTLTAGSTLVLYANNPDTTPGIHLGFSLDQNGEGVFLFHRAASGGALLDSVRFGLQLADRSLGRVAGGDWVLTQPTFGAANTSVAMGNPNNLKINEWIAAGLNPNPEDRIELYNPEPLPVALGGLHLTDQPIGAPARHRIAALSFIAPAGYAVFIADDDTGNGSNHLSFRLALEQGEIGLFSPELAPIDCVIYGPQQPAVSSGRCPDGALRQTFLVSSTFGAPNACPFEPPAPQMVSLITISNVWRYDESGINLGTAWLAPGYNDSGWFNGQALLGFDAAVLPEPFRTPFTLSTTKTTFYFRATFNVPPNANFSALRMRHVIDDGVVAYLNGNEIHRYNMPAGPVSATTLASGNIGDAVYQGPFDLPTAHLVAGANVLAAELHQSAATSGDLAFGLELSGLIVTNSPALAGILLNEVLANNAALEEADGSTPDYVELYNPSLNPVNVADMSLTDDTLLPRRWVFPLGSILPARGFLKVRLDANAPAFATNTGFGLKANGGAVYLFNRPADGGTLASSMVYGLQPADWSIGRVPDGSANWTLTLPTLGSANIAANLGNTALLKMNEWMAAPVSGQDWFEVFNPNAQPVNLSGLFLSDNLANRQQYQIPTLSFISPGGFQRFIADDGTDADFTGFRLGAGGEDLAISSANGTLIDGVSFGAQQDGVSQGRLPDGAAGIVSFASTPTPGNSNFLPLNNAVVNEVLSHSDPPLEDALEFYNPSGDDVNIGGWYLSDSQNSLLKYRIPANTILRAGGYLVLYEYQFNGEHPGEMFSLSSARGDQVYLSQTTPGGQLTGYRAFAEFGPAANGVSFGRFPTSAGVDFTALSARTFGRDNPATTNEFRMGTGRTNASAKVGPVVINEIMYHPLGTNDALEYVELHNLLGTAVPLYDPANPQNIWRLRKGVDFDFAPNTVLPAGGYLVVVSFDPQTDAAARGSFQAVYGSNGILLGPYSGRLDNAGETVELQMPDLPQTIPGPDFGLVPYVVVDRVNYGDTAPWPSSPDGSGNALIKVASALYGNDPVHWVGGAPTPGAVNFASAGNTAPALNPIGNKTINEGAFLSFSALATDADAPPQTLTFSLDPGALGGAGIDPATGLFTWTPGEDRGPGAYPVTIRVTDSGSPVLSDFETITITVQEVNTPPILNPIGNKQVNENELVTFTASAIDLDLPAQTLTYSLGAGAPPNAQFHPSSGVFTWTPSEGDEAGVYAVTVRVTDNGSPSLIDSETITITVTEINSPPMLSPISDQRIHPGSLLTVMASAMDADLPAQALTFSLAPGAPAGASINSTNGHFTWTPAAGSSASTNDVTVRVADNGVPMLEAATTFKAMVVPLRITIARAGPTTVSLTWRSIPGRTYRLHYKDTLNAGPWSQLGADRLAASDTLSVTDNLNASSQRFYRLQALP